jgi:hypothetical protein
VKGEVLDLFDQFVADAESYGAENLYLARQDEGYVGDPKEFRFSHVYARRLPTYKHELLLDYIEEYSRIALDRLRRRLMAKEADWMRSKAKKLYEEESSRSRGAGSEKKSARQLSLAARWVAARGERVGDLGVDLMSRLQPVDGLRIAADADRELTRFWQSHPELRAACLRKYGFDPIDEAADYWHFGLAEPPHAHLAREVRQNGGVFSLPLVKRWEAEELSHA